MTYDMYCQQSHPVIEVTNRIFVRGRSAEGLFDYGLINGDRDRDMPMS